MPSNQEKLIEQTRTKLLKLQKDQLKLEKDHEKFGKAIIEVLELLSTQQTTDIAEPKRRPGKIHDFFSRVTSTDEANPHFLKDINIDEVSIDVIKQGKRFDDFRDERGPCSIKKKTNENGEKEVTIFRRPLIK